MFAALYLRRLGRDLDRWVEQHLISIEQAQAMRRSVEAESARGNRAMILAALGLIGALLVGVGVVSIVAANWENLPKLAKLALIGLALWASYGGAWAARSRQHDWLAQGLLLLGVLVFGASIALVAQIYHLPADAPGGILLWCIGTFATAMLAPSQPAAVAGVGLAALWSALIVGDSWRYDPVHWWFLPVWLAWAAPIVLWRWRVATHAALAALLFWSLLAVLQSTSGDDFRADTLPVTAFWVLAAAVGFAGVRRERMADLAELLRRYALAAVLGGTFLIANLRQWESHATVEPQPLRTAAAALLVLLAGAVAWRVARDRRPLPWLCGAILAALFVGSGLTDGGTVGAVTLALHVAYIAGVIGLIAWSYAVQDRFAVNLGFVSLGIALLDVYFDSAWLLLNRGLFFVCGGILLLVLAWLFERQRRRLLGGLEAPS